MNLGGGRITSLFSLISHYMMQFFSVVYSAEYTNYSCSVSSQNQIFSHHSSHCMLYSLGSQVALVVKNLPANAGDLRDVGSIPG